jgi:predicted nucleotidyltransferase
MKTLIQEDPANLIVDVIIEAAQPEQVILFGSRARGTFGGESDFDFLVVVPEVENEREISRQIYRALLRNSVRQAVDIIVVSRKKLEYYRESPAFIYSQAVREGKIYYERA